MAAMLRSLTTERSALMSEVDRSRLTALAEAARRGSWTWRLTEDRKCADFITACSPDVVLALLAELAEKDAETEGLRRRVAAGEVAATTASCLRIEVADARERAEAAEVRASTAERERDEATASALRWEDRAIRYEGYHEDAAASLELHRAENARLTAEIADPLGDLVCGCCEGPTKNVDLFCDACRMNDLEVECDKLRAEVKAANRGYEAKIEDLRVETSRLDALFSAVRECQERAARYPAKNAVQAARREGMQMVCSEVLRLVDDDYRGYVRQTRATFGTLRTDLALETEVSASLAAEVERLNAAALEATRARDAEAVRASTAEAELAKVRAAARDLFQASNDIHPVYGSTSVCHGGIGGQAITEHCAQTCSNPVHDAVRDAFEAAMVATYHALAAAALVVGDETK